MEATASDTKRILECVEEAKSPHRILVRSLLKSRNALRGKYRELRAECKRWRNQAAAVARSRDTWRERALTAEADLRDRLAARAAHEPEPSATSPERAGPRIRSAEPPGVEKRGR
jgi:hypothetical protein